MWNVCACFSGEIHALAGVPETAAAATATSISVDSLVEDTSVPPLSTPCDAQYSSIIEKGLGRDCSTISCLVSILPL